MTKLKFEPFYDDEGNIRAVAIIKTCPDCGEQYVSTILTDGSEMRGMVLKGSSPSEYLNLYYCHALLHGVSLLF